MAAPKGNTYWKLAAWHRKPHYETEKELEDVITEYFNNETSRGKCKPTIAGLTYFLGFGSRTSFNDYMNKSEAFSNIISKARKFIESCYESELYNKNNMASFALTNMDREAWKMKTETDITTNGKSIGFDLTKATDEELAIIEGIIARGNKGGEV